MLVSDRSGWSLNVVPSVALPGLGDLVLGVVPLVTVLDRGGLLVRMVPSVAVRSVAPYPAPMCGRRCRHWVAVRPVLGRDALSLEGWTGTSRRPPARSAFLLDPLSL